MRRDRERESGKSESVNANNSRCAFGLGRKEEFGEDIQRR